MTPVKKITGDCCWLALKFQVSYRWRGVSLFRHTPEKLSHSHTHTHTLPLTHSLTHSLTHTHTHTPTVVEVFVRDRHAHALSSLTGGQTKCTRIELLCGLTCLRAIFIALALRFFAFFVLVCFFGFLVFGFFCGGLAYCYPGASFVFSSWFFFFSFFLNDRSEPSPFVVVSIIYLFSFFFSSSWAL